MTFKVLIVDDSKTIHAYVKSLLKVFSEIATESVFNGEEAVQLLSARPDFDLVLLDWEMPIMDGPQTLTTLKEQNFKSPIVMMTTKNSLEDIERMIQLGAAEYVMKPFTTDILLEKIEMATGRGFLNVV